MRANGNHFRDFVNDRIEEDDETSGQGIPFNQAHQAYQSRYNSKSSNSGGQKNRRNFKHSLDEKFKTKKVRRQKQSIYRY